MKYEINLTENQANRVNDFLLGLKESFKYSKGELKLKPVQKVRIEDTEAYKCKLVDIRRMLVKICDMPCSELNEIFSEFGCQVEYDYQIDTILKHYTIENIEKMMQAYEKKAEEEIKVGDVVEHEKGEVMVVTRVNKHDQIISGVCASGKYFNRDMTKWHKTGKHYNIEEMLKELEECRESK